MTLSSLLVTKIQYFSWKITYGRGVAASARQKSNIKMRLRVWVITLIISHLVMHT